MTPELIGWSILGVLAIVAVWAYAIDAIVNALLEDEEKKGKG